MTTTATTMWNQYEVAIRPLAKGSRLVYRGYDRDRQREVAIKLYKNGKRGQREANVMKRYQHHPVLPQFFEYFTIGERGYLVMELVKGRGLDYPCGGIPRSPQLAVAITKQILRGLSHLHDHGVLHYDIAHHNVMIHGDRPTTVKIVDFCGAKIQDSQGIWRTRRVGGTIGFRPPEQENVPNILHPSSDLFATARLCHWLITKTLPHPKRREVLRDQALRTILDQGMHPCAEARFQSAQEFLAALKQWVPQRP